MHEHYFAAFIMEIHKICFICSAQDILDGVDPLLSPLVDLANSLIDAVLSALPSFNLPGMCGTYQYTQIYNRKQVKKNPEREQIQNRKPSFLRMNAQADMTLHMTSNAEKALDKF